MQRSDVAAHTRHRVDAEGRRVDGKCECNPRPVRQPLECLQVEPRRPIDGRQQEIGVPSPEILRYEPFGGQIGDRFAVGRQLDTPGVAGCSERRVRDFGWKHELRGRTLGAKDCIHEGRGDHRRRRRGAEDGPQQIVRAPRHRLRRLERTDESTGCWVAIGGYPIQCAQHRLIDAMGDPRPSISERPRRLGENLAH